MAATRDWQHRPQELESLDDVIGDVLLRLTRVQELEELEPEPPSNRYFDQVHRLEMHDHVEPLDRGGVHAREHDPRDNRVDDDILMSALDVLGETRVQESPTGYGGQPGQKCCHACGKNVAG